MPSSLACHPLAHHCFELGQGLWQRNRHGEVISRRRGRQSSSPLGTPEPRHLRHREVPPPLKGRRTPHYSSPISWRPLPLVLNGTKSPQRYPPTTLGKGEGSVAGDQASRRAGRITISTGRPVFRVAQADDCPPSRDQTQHPMQGRSFRTGARSKQPGHAARSGTGTGCSVSMALLLERGRVGNGVPSIGHPSLDLQDDITPAAPSASVLLYIRRK